MLSLVPGRHRNLDIGAAHVAVVFGYTDQVLTLLWLVLDTAVVVVLVGILEDRSWRHLAHL